MSANLEQEQVIRLAAKAVVVAQRRALRPKEIFDRLPEQIRVELKLTRHHFYRQISAGDGLIHRPDGRWTVDVDELWDVDRMAQQRTDAAGEPPLFGPDAAADAAFMTDHGIRFAREPDFQRRLTAAEEALGVDLQDVTADVAFMVDRYGAQSVHELHRQLAPRASYKEFRDQVAAAVRSIPGLALKCDIVFER
ncbi:hypothetical protein [Bradyrhizobium diazoefficiens]|uniref:hypothetical protein n=1 Tax=Bradyrhizobium diazoefficiens TaxID=1355477 RepID=UPI002714843F|nr:hypothetical protein [Bradyrhizobium diazoefficiens]WLC17120.1 hypothetical protein QIH76_01495 [Bradyrhizobium diazoefficiens]